MFSAGETESLLVNECFKKAWTLGYRNAHSNDSSNNTSIVEILISPFLDVAEIENNLSLDLIMN